MKETIFVLAFTVVVLLTAISYGGDGMGKTEMRVVEIANEKAAELGYDLTKFNVKVTRHSTPSNPCLQTDSGYRYPEEEKLKGREYFAVYYHRAHKEEGTIYKGGEFCIFVDSVTNEVITALRWK